MAAFARPVVGTVRSQALTALLPAAAVGILTLGAMQKLGQAGLLAPLGLGAFLLLARYPRVTTCLTLALVILCEPNFGFLPMLDEFYVSVKGFTTVDALLLAAVLGTVVRLTVARQRPQLPPAVLTVPLALLALALIAGLYVGREAGVGMYTMLLASHSFIYLLIIPLLVFNVGFTARDIRLILLGGLGLAVVKAVLGLMALASGQAVSLSATDTTALTYLEPTANWLGLVALLWIVAGALRRGRPPLWVLTTAPLIAGCLILSYRRSFWIGLAVGALIVVVLGTSPVGRRVLFPTAAVVAATIWLVGSSVLPTDSAIVRRATSLQSESIAANSQDRYRTDERVNVWANIREHPVSGIGIAVPWTAEARPLPLDLGRQYAHVAALYWWLKLGVLGLLAYLATIAGAAAMSWQVWRRSADPRMRALGLASLAAVVALVPIEMTASFTGVEPRFTTLFGAQLGLLALLVLIVRRDADGAAGRTDDARTEPVPPGTGS